VELHDLKPPKGSKKNRKRVGRGSGSGMGKTSGRGHKGQRARSGSRKKIGFEGGQMPLHRRIPKFGFTNIFKKEYQVVNLAALNNLEPGEITGETLKQAGLVKNTIIPIKILGKGEVAKAFTIKAAAFSKSAVAKIEAAGGKTEVI